MPRVTVLAEACKGIDECGICVYVCPEQLFEPSRQMNESGYYPPVIKKANACTGCLNCTFSCPDFAIVVDIDEDPISNTKKECDATKQ